MLVELSGEGDPETDGGGALDSAEVAVVGTAIGSESAAARNAGS
ncbi:hypothetical protein [Halosimplex pelagicum]|nr:hypothetical protein [Halosimplex pelagicum]